MALILAHKLEMTRVVKDWKLIPVTLLEVASLKVIQVKTVETDWYNSIVVWILKWDFKWELKEWKTSLNSKEFSQINEFRLPEEEVSNFNVWDDINIDVLDWIEKVNLVWVSKWKWFTWAMKRYNFSGWPKTHGSKFHRALGSIGNRKPTRTHKWKKMHGHHWNKRVSLRWVSLELLNKDLKVVWVKWAVPGARKSLVLINF